jgi:hypothetical protein
LNNVELVSYDKDIKEIADKLAHGDSFLADELRAMMFISILTSKLRDKDTILSIARLRAVDYLYERGGDHESCMEI